jgi:hypothetical protein
MGGKRTFRCYPYSMTLDELMKDLRTILAAEEQSPPDWRKVELLCLRTVERLAADTAPPYPHDIVYHFLDDPDVRRRDRHYGELQRAASAVAGRFLMSAMGGTRTFPFQNGAGGLYAISTRWMSP